jgi:hypothetical protein
MTGEQSFLNGRVCIRVGDITRETTCTIRSRFNCSSFSVNLRRSFFYPRHEATAVASRAIKEFLAPNDKLTELR